MEKNKIIGFVIIGLLIGGGILSVALFKSPSPTGRAITEVNKEVLKGDIFKGKITNSKVEASTLKGIGVYDKSCKMGTDGLTTCDAGIKTEQYGVLNFNYRHNMQQQPCLAPNDILEIRIRSDGTAEVQRTA